MKILFLLLTLSLYSCSLKRLDDTYNGCYRHCKHMNMKLQEVRVDGTCVCEKNK